MEIKIIRSVILEGFQVGEALAKGGEASEICEPFPYPAVASGSTETEGGIAGELTGLRGRVFTSCVP